ncbi:Zn-dependent metalloprotease [Nocardioides ginsengisegetis]|uniref:Neutral metalloproteinase n=1 Tax=Nocardioides ginsengisegetis TaxID=661491 RepID=A0A7W3J466_9ACTN|nr:M4 family metallopeptidase [Nocardioides ginsengisegetis]MBA8805912.1 Zn-dependent metalloprotease [Nocardioides ginsengisegetis]
MKPTLASALALGCVSAALVATAGNSQAADTTHDVRGDSIASARSNAEQHAGVGRGQDLRVKDTVLDKDGGSHVRFTRTFRGLEVVGGDFVVHQAQGGRFESVSGSKLTQGLHLATTPTVSAQRAATKAAHAVDFAGRKSSPELVVLAAHRAPALAWRVDVTGRNADGSPAGEYVFVDARKGGVLASWPSVLEDTGTGTGLFTGTVPLETTLTGGQYTMVDASRGGNATYNGPYGTSTPLFTDADNVWGNGSTSNAQTAGVDAHYGIAKTWDFYKNTYGRNGIANDGKGARSFVHDGAYVNASWSDSCFCMRYGDGDATTYPLVALDVAGHEMSHGVTSRTAGLTYRGESGGLNEANSDIFGTMVEWYANMAGDTPDYVIGEQIYRAYNPATNYIRRMDKPSMDGGSQDCWSTATKRVDVHYSSGPANHYFYLLSEGSGAKTINGIAYNSPTCNGSTITGIGRDAAAKIWYRALTVYMTSSTNYAGARVANVNAATDLYGATSTQVAAVKAAWSAVSVN